MYCRFTGEGSCRPKRSSPVEFATGNWKEVINVAIKFAVIDEKVQQILRGWETAAPEQSFGDMTLEQFKQALQPYLAAKAAFETINTQWESAQQTRVDTFPKALELATGIAACVKGHPKYGANSSAYAAMGYTTKSARSSGLTRRRDAETPKETA